MPERNKKVCKFGNSSELRPKRRKHSFHTLIIDDDDDDDFNEKHSKPKVIPTTNI